MSVKVFQDKDPDIELFVKVRQKVVCGILMKDRDSVSGIGHQFVLESSRNPIGEMRFQWQVDPGSPRQRYWI